MNDKIIITIDSDLEELIPGFLENREKDVDSLETALTNEDFDSLRIIGHNLKGLGGGYGFDEMSDIGMKIENAGKSADADTAKAQINALKEYLSKIEVVFE